MNNNIKPGDWVLIKSSTLCTKSYQYFLDSPCEVISLDKLSSSNPGILLECEGIEVWWRLNDIENYSSDKKAIYAFIKARKFNV